jgi:MSHA biogenesis protein MshI
MQWFKPQNNASLVAMRLAGDHACLAQVTKRADAKPYVNLAAVEPCSINDPEALKNLVKQYKLNKHPVSFLLELDDYQHIQIERPNVPANELKEAVRWMLKDLVEFPVEDISLDVIEIPFNKLNPDNQHYLYAIISQNKIIAALSNRLLDAKVNLQVIDARMMAQRNIANCLAEPNQGEALLTFSKTGALLTFTHEGEICNARYIEGGNERNASAFEKIALELQRSLDGFEAKFRDVFIKKLLVAPFDLREQFCAHLRESIYTKVDTFELEDIFEFSPDIDIGSLSKQASLLPALGAALRDEVAK